MYEINTDVSAVIDGENYRFATVWLSRFQTYFSRQVDFDNNDALLRDYREFVIKWRKWHTLPDSVKKLMPIRHSYPGLVPTSWGHYTHDWILRLNDYLHQAEVDTSANDPEVDNPFDSLTTLIGDLEGTFLPEDYYQFFLTIS